MACLGCSCSTGSDDTKASGCGQKGGCSTGGCNRKNTYDWITAMGITDAVPFDVVEVSFKNGAHKHFYKNPPYTRATTGDFVCVEAQSGFDVGQVSLSGELVRLQMKKKRVRPDSKLGAIVRIANQRDMEKLDYMRSKERDSLIRARAIARSLKLKMKIGDVEFQGDGRKATFYYTAEGRVDFRELIRSFAKEFKVKIEMRQIGMRQESALVGGLGNCGRELCCSTWLTNFKSVNTSAARYQNLAINQTKLTGMCGRLKCCLNYELDAYIDALEEFPNRADRLRTEEGNAILIKTDVFKRLMYYTYEKQRGRLFPLHVEQVWEVLDLMKEGKMATSLADIETIKPKEADEEEELEYENIHNVIQLPIEKRRKKKKKKRRKNPNTPSGQWQGGNRQEAKSRGQGNSKSARPQKPSKPSAKKSTPKDKSTDSNSKRYPSKGGAKKSTPQGKSKPPSGGTTRYPSKKGGNKPPSDKK